MSNVREEGAFEAEQMGDVDALAELNELFSEDDERLKESEAKVLSQNLSGFASCFPDWDLHPPVD